MRDIFFFDKMLTPKIITIVYWVMLVVAVIGGFASMFRGYGFSFTSFIMGIIYAIVGVVFARIWCELLIVLFKMNEALQEIRHK